MSASTVGQNPILYPPATPIAPKDGSIIQLECGHDARLDDILAKALEGLTNTQNPVQCGTCGAAVTKIDGLVAIHTDMLKSVNETLEQLNTITGELPEIGERQESEETDSSSGRESPFSITDLVAGHTELSNFVDSANERLGQIQQQLATEQNPEVIASLTLEQTELHKHLTEAQTQLSNINEQITVIEGSYSTEDSSEEEVSPSPVRHGNCSLGNCSIQ